MDKKKKIVEADKKNVKVVRTSNKFAAKKNSVFYATRKGELLELLFEMIKDKSKMNIKSLLKSRQIILKDSAVTQFDYPINIGDKIEVCWSKTRQEVKLSRIKILHEDNDIIVIEKAPGLLSMASENEREETAYNMLKEYVKSKDPENKIFIVHRLDRDTSGVMVFARSEEVQQLMQTQWQDLVKKRCYVAVVEGVVEEKEGQIVSWLKENSAYVTFSSPTDNGGKKAITHYRVLKENKFFTMLEAQIVTGRKNQIRVHMQDLGHSIVGDKKYGATKSPLSRLGLHAHVLIFTHPKTQKLLRFEMAIPSKFISLFGKSFVIVKKK